MADNIEMELRGDRKLGLRFEEAPRKFRAKLREVISESIDQLYGQILAAEPKGKTHKLASGTVHQIFDDPNKITGRVAIADPTQFAKAGALEYGSAGDFDVAGHAMRLDHVFANKLSSPLTVFVDAHARQGGLGAYRFLRGPAAEEQGAIIENMRASIGQAVTETDSE